MAPLRVSTTKSEWLPDDPTAFVPTRLWKLPFITTWDDSRNQNRPTDSAEEAEKQVTAIITGEPRQGSYTRHGLEEYISDCVILLDNRVREQIATRRIRVMKYRGSKHGTNEYPFVIDNDGLSVIPIT